ncbi:MAG TPA: hypothetical protein VK843_07965 [Planctomycetota bacterium]|nr:hypothetical protein [Planctomycetota bacterium]
MVAWSDLILPILLSAALIFVASSLIHAVLKLHNSEYHKLSNEEEVRAVIRKGSPAPAMYMVPHCHEGKPTPETTKKFEEGPNFLMYVRPAGKVQMGGFLLKWFLYTLVVSTVAAYLARALLHPGDHYLAVFRVVGTATWLAYAWQGPSDSIWAGKPWNVTFRAMFDGLVYACLTAGAFGWLWPKA